MKIFLLIPVLSLVLFSCSSSGGDDGGGNSGGGDDDNPIVNTAPTVPSLSNPTNNLLCIDNNLTFDWVASTDSDGDEVKYLLELSKDNQFSELTHNFDNLSTTSKTILLDKGVAYYWRVKALDNKDNESDYSSVFQLYTEGVGEVNHLPFLPSLIAPSIDEKIAVMSTSLSWDASDTDVADVLTYDVYLDTNNPPTSIVSSSMTTKKYTASSLTSATKYYWKIVVKDDKGGSAIGPVWSFETE